MIYLTLWSCPTQQPPRIALFCSCACTRIITAIQPDKRSPSLSSSSSDRSHTQMCQFFPPIRIKPRSRVYWLHPARRFSIRSFFFPGWKFPAGKSVQRGRTRWDWSIAPPLIVIVDVQGCAAAAALWQIRLIEWFEALARLGELECARVWAAVARV